MKRIELESNQSDTIERTGEMLKVVVVVVLVLDLDADGCKNGSGKNRLSY